MLPEIKDIIKSEAEKKHEYCGNSNVDVIVDIRRESYISGREEGIEDMFRFVEWTDGNAILIDKDRWLYDWINEPRKELTTEQLYLEYKKL